MTRFGKPGWLPELLREVQAAPRPPRAAEQANPRAYLRYTLRQSGLHYGTPADVEGLSELAGGPEEKLFVAVLRTLARVALDIADITGASAERRESALLVLFATLCGRFTEAELLDRSRRKADSLQRRRRVRRIEEALEERAPSLAGDPLYGLLLHNGAVYVDAHRFGREAVDLFQRGGFDASRAQRRNEVAARQKVLLVEVLVALACAEQPPSRPARRAILRQVEDLRLPSLLEGALKGRLHLAFEGAPELAPALAAGRSVGFRRFVLEQAVLASIVQGRRSPAERRFLGALAQSLRFSAEALQQVELEVAAFYATHRGLVDIFTVAPAAAQLGEQLLGGVTLTLQRSLWALMTEIRETGELSVLLAKAARGHTLSAEERRRMREQLIDVAKVIPALALFAAPGGVFILIALAKVLPFSLLPSAFQRGTTQRRPVPPP